jgi:Ca2+-transporting ATPase
MGIFDYWKKKERAKPDFSTVRSGGSAAAPEASPTPRAEGDSSAAGSVEARTHVVMKGDSLSWIASGQYGDPEKWPKIYEANRDLIKDPDVIYPGQQLRIPD